MKILLNAGGREPETLRELIGQAVGAGSVCWENMSGTGVFQDDRARQVVDDAVEWVEKYYAPDQDALDHLAAYQDAFAEPLFEIDCD